MKHEMVPVEINEAQIGDSFIFYFWFSIISTWPTSKVLININNTTPKQTGKKKQKTKYFIQNINEI